MTGEYNSRLKLLCYNVFYKEIEERKDNIFEVFLTRDADVMLLQEVSIPWIPRLKEFMEEHGYSYYGYGRRGGEMMDKEMHSHYKYNAYEVLALAALRTHLHTSHPFLLSF